jgi:PAS domain S-box-containing protein
MSMPLRLLILEDRESDVELILHELRRAGFDPDWRRVQTEAEYLANLARSLDVILADYNLPGFDAARALELLQERDLDIPFIIVSGMISEEVAVECMKRGAADYLLKDRLTRLGQAVEQAIEQRRLRVAKGALKIAEARYRHLFDSVPVGIYRSTADGRVLDANQTMIDMLGYAGIDALRAVNASDLYVDRDDRVRLLELVTHEPVVRGHEVRFRRVDGQIIWVRLSARGLRDDSGRLQYLDGMLEDVTERHRTEDDLRLLGSAVSQASESVMITTAKLDEPGPEIVLVNPAFTHMTGYTAAEVLGRTPRLLQGPKTDRGVLARLRRKLEAGEEFFGEAINYRKDGTEFYLAWHIAPVHDQKGQISHFVAIQRDITEAKRMAEQFDRQREALYQSEKLSAMGQLLAGVAHELNNPLSVVLGHAGLLLRDATPALAERGTKISEAAERCARIVRNFLALARQHPMQHQRVDLNQVVQGAIELLAYPMRVDSVEVTLNLGQLPDLWADPDQLHQVVVNLASNAHQAMRESAEPRRLIITTRHETGHIILEVADTGPGVPREIQSRIFEPFFTTKAPGIGTGLGLSLCMGIVERHQGTLLAESTPGRGATFKVVLPLVAPPLQPAQTAERAPVLKACSILVIDDELSVAELLAEILSGDGHSVEIALNGAEALLKLREQAYDFVFCDVKMPKLDGPATYQEVERIRPELLSRWIFLTGDSFSVETAEFLERTHAPTLSKPFNFEELRRLMADIGSRTD